MRSAVTVLFIVALLVIWVTTQYSDETRSSPELTGSDVAPVTMPRDTSLPIEGQEAFQASVPDDAISDTIDVNTFQDTKIRTAAIEFGPETRAGIVDYFSRSGLAAIDGERIADSVLDGVRECVEQAFGNGEEEPSGSLIEACMYNVFADYGLNENPATEVDLAISLPQ